MHDIGLLADFIVPEGLKPLDTHLCGLYKDLRRRWRELLAALILWGVN
jgi:hypothetical protein